jgi:hypothetical protein
MNRNRIVVDWNEWLNNGYRIIGRGEKVTAVPKEAGGSHET